jgi:hypothetical protein
MFKYMPFRASFFDDPLLRLTPPGSLNDPFDSKPTNLAVEKKVSAFYDFGDPVKDSEKKYYRESLKEGLQEFGIISLTENPYSLLMWSHYAEEHRGVVVSLACDEDTFEYHCPFSKTCGVSKLIPSKVFYSSRRPGFEMPDNTIYEYFEHNFFSHIALVKSDDWIYEKEYRYLIRLAEVDAAVFTLVAGADFSKVGGDDVIIDHIHSNLYKVQASSAATAQGLIWWLALAQGRKVAENVMYFKRLNPDAVTGVYLGCNVSDSNVKEVARRIMASERVNSAIPIYRARQSTERFEIDFEILGSAESLNK